MIPQLSHNFGQIPSDSPRFRVVPTLLKGRSRRMGEFQHIEKERSGNNKKPVNFNRHNNKGREYGNF
jgi:hypothetical protein